MNINRTLGIKALVITTLLAASMAANAEGRHGGEERRGGEEWQGGEWHGARGPWHNDFRHFDRHDLKLWRNGAWHHDWHGGRLGWWWIAGGEWFFYPQPVYPYPDPYAYVYPGTIVVQRTAPQPAVLPPAQQVWYYCAAANGYYPYVPTCPAGWQAVPATPPVAPPVAPTAPGPQANVPPPNIAPPPVPYGVPPAPPAPK